MKKSRLLSTSGLLCIIFIFSVSVLPFRLAAERSGFVLVQFIIIGVIALFNLLYESNRHPYSLSLIHWFFVFAFIFCGGLTQFAQSAYGWHLIATIPEVVYANWIVIIWEIVFWIIQRATFVFKFGKKRHNFKHEKLYASGRKLLLLIVLLIGIGLYPLSRAGIKVYFIRSLYGPNSITHFFGTQSIQIALNSIIVGFTLWGSVSAIDNLKKKRTGMSIIVVILAFMALVLNVPLFAVPRYEMAAVYGGLLIFHWKRLKEGKFFIYFLAIGLLIVFPLLNAFRGSATQIITIEGIESSLGSIGGNFTRADYDAFTMLVYSVRYVANYGIKYGSQLLGAILFFVPRAIWASKPGGSGAMMIKELSIGVNPNVSCPLFAEGYINFGLTGVVLFSFLLSYIVRRADYRYWSSEYRFENSFSMVYSSSIPFLIFIMRGDLMSSLAFFIGFVASNILYKKIVLSEELSRPEGDLIR